MVLVISFQSLIHRILTENEIICLLRKLERNLEK
jgi:hypothetical protein